MFELLVLILFCWLFFRTVRLACKVAWGLAKIIAVILYALAPFVLIGCIFMAGKFMFLIPLMMVGSAFGILRSRV